MSTHNICFHGKIRKIAILSVENWGLSGAMKKLSFFANEWQQYLTCLSIHIILITLSIGTERPLQTV